MTINKLAYAQNSTNVLLKRTIRAVDALAPTLTARWAEQIFRTPPHFSPSTAEKTVLALGHRFTFRAAGKTLAAWSWGEGPTIFLAHGWGGRGGQFFCFVEPLLRAGYSVVTFDAPGHGQTPGSRSSLVDFSESLREIARALGPAEGIIAHSLGAPAAALAMQNGLKVPRAVFIASPTSPVDFSIELAQKMGISDRTRLLMQERMERRYDLPWSRLELTETARAMTAKLLMFHDRHDTQVPWTKGAALAASWPGAELVTTENLGHTRILRNADVIQRTVGFLKGHSSREADIAFDHRPSASNGKV